MVHFGVLYNSGGRRGPKRRGARGSLPPPHSLDGPDGVVLYAGCGVNKFTCENAFGLVFCVPASHTCNFFSNCLDVSDERGCTSASQSTLLVINSAYGLTKFEKLKRKAMWMECFVC